MVIDDQRLESDSPWEKVTGDRAGMVTTLCSVSSLITLIQFTVAEVPGGLVLEDAEAALVGKFGGC